MIMWCFMRKSFDSIVLQMQVSVRIMYRFFLCCDTRVQAVDVGIVEIAVWLDWHYMVQEYYRVSVKSLRKEP